MYLCDELRNQPKAKVAQGRINLSQPNAVGDEGKHKSLANIAQERMRPLQTLTLRTFSLCAACIKLKVRVCGNKGDCKMDRGHRYPRHFASAAECRRLR